jgi:hypothetical protein
MKNALRSLLGAVSSLKLTVVCLSAAMVLVFVGTLAQVDGGIHDVQKRYFQSLFVRWPDGPGGFPIFPGGHLIIIVLLVNLLTAHIRRFRWTAAKIGIHLIHGGLVVMLLGALLTDFFAVESTMRLLPSQTIGYAESQESCELAIVETSGKDFDTVTTIPQSLLERGGEITDPSLPFRVVVKSFHRNARFVEPGRPGAESKQASTRGVGARTAVVGVRPATAMNERNVQAAVIAIEPLPEAKDEQGGSWLTVNEVIDPQTLSYGGKTWALFLRPTRHDLPFQLTLRSFAHDLYPGTQIPKNFSSRVRLTDSAHGESREVAISMNRPLRYRGVTVYQSGFLPGDSGTILQVVRNPGFLAPYLGCLLVGIGMVWQFAYHFVGFLACRRRTA